MVTDGIGTRSQGRSESLQMNRRGTVRGCHAQKLLFKRGIKGPEKRGEKYWRKTEQQEVVPDREVARNEKL
nr:MAG TPA: hypothetical protein [Caudoviricetes sp.]